MKTGRIMRASLWLVSGAITFMSGCQTNWYSIAVQGTSLSLQSLLYAEISAITDLIAANAGI